MRLLPRLIFILSLISSTLCISNPIWGWLGMDGFRLLKIGERTLEVVSETDNSQMRRSPVKFVDVTNQVPIDEQFEKGLVGLPPQGPWNKLLFLGSKQIKSLKKPIPAYKYPTKASHYSAVTPLFDRISNSRMFQNLSRFTSFYTRYYKSKYGLESANWLYEQIAQVAKPLEDRVLLKKTKHEGWDQYSIVLSIPGETKDKVIVSAHQDSLNLLFPSALKAPGADDDGSGCITILESMNVIMEELSKNRFKPVNTLEFHFYSAEEGGMLGSTDILSGYRRDNEVVLGMLQQDMTGFTVSTVDHDVEKHFGLVRDYASIPLNEFLKTIIGEYTELPYHETYCGYACSDHVSGTENGFPSSLVIESEFKYTSRFTHSSLDTIDRLDWDHIHEHVKLTIAYLYELGMAKDLYNTE